MHLLNAARLAKVKPGSVIINTGRGALIDEAALAAALQSGQVAAAGLDVFEAEPNVPAELLALEQVVLTPHIGSATAECRAAIMRRGIANLVAFLETGAVLDPVS
jgi:glyoxylate reductase